MNKCFLFSISLLLLLFTSCGTKEVVEPETFTNPLIWADCPDPSVIRVDSTFYMVSTSMHFSPGCCIMKSKDLVNWSVLTYAHRQLEELDGFALKNGKNDYAKGSWAANLRYDKYEKRFYLIVTCNTTQQSYIFTTTDIENGTWHKNVVNLSYDPGFLFEDTGTECRKYVIHPNFSLQQNNAFIEPLYSDGNGGVTLGPDSVIIDYTQMENPPQGLRAEGYHAYKIGEYYYIFMIQGQNMDNSWQRQQIVWRSKTLQRGTFEGRKVFTGEIINADSTFFMKSVGVAQGGLVDTPDGKWYAMMFQDNGAVGRIPVLVPVVFGEDGWPIFGNNGMSVNHELPAPMPLQEPQDIVVSDDFNQGEKRHYISDTELGTGVTAGMTCEQIQELWKNNTPAEYLEKIAENEYGYNGSNLKIEWQWNHNPNNNLWSLTERPGYLRLKAGILAHNILDARNTLTQRTFGPSCTGTISVDLSCMNDGDVVGLSIFQIRYGFVGVRKDDGHLTVVMQRAMDKEDADGTVIESVKFDGNTQIYLHAHCDYVDRHDKVTFYYSTDGSVWKEIGEEMPIYFDMPHFCGNRFAIFYYPTIQPGGHVDVDYFDVAG